MKSLRRLILIFAAGLALPLGYLVVQAYRSLDAEEAATFGFFAEALFDAMQASAAELVRREEARPVDAYAGPAASALFGLPAEDYIRGYFQNDPDGGFQTPHRSSGPAALRAPASRLAELEEANRVFNRKRADGTDRVRAETAETARDEKRRAPAGFSEKYLDLSRSQRSKSYLGEKDSRLQAVTPEQAFNLSGLEKKQAPPPPAPAAGTSARERRKAEAPAAVAQELAVAPSAADRIAEVGASGADAELQAEVAPFQSVWIDAARVFVFRRILIEGRMYRQGFVLQLDLFLSHLAHTHFRPSAGSRWRTSRTSGCERSIRAAKCAQSRPERPPTGRVSRFRAPSRRPSDLCKRR